MENAEIAARIEILEVIGKYAWYSDARLESDDHARLAELVAGLFTDDGLYKTVRMDGSEQSCRGRENIRRHLEERRAAWVATPEARRVRRYSRHHVTPLMIEFETPRRALGRSYVAIIGTSGIYNWGSYFDTFVLEPSGWKFAERVVHIEGGAGPG